MRRRTLLAATAGILLATITVLEVWNTPPRWLMPARHQTSGALHWARTNWLGTASLTAIAAIAGSWCRFFFAGSIAAIRSIQPGARGTPSSARSC